MVNLELPTEPDDNSTNTDTAPAYASRAVTETETVDVAYLLRRLLERVKSLAKAEKAGSANATGRSSPTTEPSTVRGCKQKSCKSSHAKTTRTSPRRCFAFHHNMVG